MILRNKIFKRIVLKNKFVIVMAITKLQYEENSVKENNYITILTMKHNLFL